MTSSCTSILYGNGILFEFIFITLKHRHPLMQFMIKQREWLHPAIAALRVSKVCVSDFIFGTSPGQFGHAHGAHIGRLWRSDRSECRIYSAA